MTSCIWAFRSSLLPYLGVLKPRSLVYDLFETPILESSPGTSGAASGRVKPKRSATQKLPSRVNKAPGL